MIKKLSKTSFMHDIIFLFLFVNNTVMSSHLYGFWMNKTNVDKNWFKWTNSETLCIYFENVDLERYLELVDLVRGLQISANKVINSQVPGKFSTSLTTKPPLNAKTLVFTNKPFSTANKIIIQRWKTNTLVFPITILL